MASINMSENAVFNEVCKMLRGIASVDIADPNDDIYIETCRGTTKTLKRCGKKPCSMHEREKVKEIWCGFRKRTDVLDEEEFYNDIKYVVEFVHCGQYHRESATEAFNKWKSEWNTHGSSSQPTTASPADSPRPSLSETSNATMISSMSEGSTEINPHPEEYLDDAVTAQVQNLKIEGPDQNPPPPDTNSDIVVVSKFETLNITATTKEALIETNQGSLGIKENTITATQSTVVAVDSTVVSQQEEDIGSTQETIVELVDPPTHVTEDAETFNMGELSLKRNGTVRDDSSVFTKIYHHPSHKDMAMGILYVLEHTKKPGFFKIGYSTKSAAERQMQPGNCYGSDTVIVYETEGGSFEGAKQAEKIAQVILRHCNILVKQCTKCNGGHREWFQASKDTICATVAIMEKFLQMPAYTLVEDEWKLSPEAHEILKEMCSFSVQKLEGNMASVVDVPGDEKDISVVPTEAVSAEDSFASESTYTAECLDQEEVVENNDATTRSLRPRPENKKKNLGDKFGNFVGGVYGKFRRISGNSNNHESGQPVEKMQSGSSGGHELRMAMLSFKKTLQENVEGFKAGFNKGKESYE